MRKRSPDAARIDPSAPRRDTAKFIVNVSQQELRSSIKPLRLVFWGGLICVLDLKFSQTVNGEGWSFDVINDLVGMLMITWAVFQLARLPVSDSYQKTITFIRVVAVLLCLKALQDHFIYAAPTVLSLLLSLLGVATMVATVMFCVAMRWLSLDADLQRAAASWRMTTVLFVVIYLIPLGIFYLAAAIAIATEKSFNIQLGAAGLLLLPVFYIPLIHLFVSTSRMKAEIEAMPGAPLGTSDPAVG